MKRMQLSLTDKQVDTLQKMARESGVSFAEMVRRVLDASPEMKEGLKRIEVGKRILKGNK